MKTSNSLDLDLALVQWAILIFIHTKGKMPLSVPEAFSKGVGLKLFFWGGQDKFSRGTMVHVRAG